MCSGSFLMPFIGITYFLCYILYYIVLPPQKRVMFPHTLSVSLTSQKLNEFPRKMSNEMDPGISYQFLLRSAIWFLTNFPDICARLSAVLGKSFAEHRLYSHLFVIYRFLRSSSVRTLQSTLLLCASLQCDCWCERLPSLHNMPVGTKLVSDYWKVSFWRQMLSR